MVFRQEARRLVWETDPDRALSKSRFSLGFGIACFVAGAALLVGFPAIWPVTLVLALFGIVGLRQGRRLARERCRIVIDADAGTVGCERSQVGATPETTSWPLAEITAVALTWRCAVTVSRTVPEGRVQVHDLCVRLLSPVGGMSLDRFRLDQRDEARSRAQVIADLLQVPVVRQSIRCDGFLFQYAPVETSMGATAQPDLRLYVRDLLDDEADDADDRVVDHSRWRLLTEPADRLAPPNTWFFA